MSWTDKTLSLRAHWQQLLAFVRARALLDNLSVTVLPLADEDATALDEARKRALRVPKLLKQLL